MATLWQSSEPGARRGCRLLIFTVAFRYGGSCLELSVRLGFLGKRCVSGPTLVVFEVVGFVASYCDPAGLCGVLCRLARVCAFKATRGLVGLALTRGMGG